MSPRFILSLCLTVMGGAVSTARAQEREAPEACPPAPPLVAVICGAPGDEEHHGVFETRLKALRRTLTGRFGIGGGDVRIYYGPESAGYAGPATRAKVEQVCREVNAARLAGRAAWVFLLGHANEAPGDMRFNLPGEDLTGKELGAWLRTETLPPGPLNLILTTACSGRAVRHLNGPGRAVIAATNATESYDETVFPDGLIQALQSPESDSDRNGLLTMTEIFLAARRNVDALYRGKGFIQTEHSVLDGDGDGRATQRPSESDSAAAGVVGHSLKITASAASSQ